MKKIMAMTAITSDIGSKSTFSLIDSWIIILFTPTPILDLKISQNYYGVFIYILIIF